MRETTIGREDLRRVCRLLKVDVGDVLVEPLSGGLSNRSFRLSHGAQQWAIRLPTSTEEHPFRTLDAECEARLLVAVAQAGLAPEVVLHDPDTGALITEYLVNAVPWTPEQARRTENVQRIAATLRSLHGVRVSPGLLSPFRPVLLAEKYLDGARRSRRGEGGRLGAEEKGWERALHRLASAYEARFPPTAPCHHDLVAANILEEDRLWLVDFEYAVLADPIIDLGSLAAMNGYDTTHRSLLMQAYFDTTPARFRSEQLDDVIRLERLLSYFWAASLGARVGEADDLSRFADSMAAMLR